MTEEKEKSEEIKILSKHDFYFETPLYERVSLEELEKRVFSGDVDAYSSKLRDNTTYKIKLEWLETFGQYYTSGTKRGYACIILTCKRKRNDTLRFFVYLDQLEDKYVRKIGQDPSMADLQFSDLQIKYGKVLDEKYLKEFKRAVGLASYGIGVGSFVYLRRIFENLISETFTNHKEQIAINDEEFKTKRMEDKIDVLKTFLPSQLVEMKVVYGILSKGLHELDEDICLKHFGPLKLSIELILDQKIEESAKVKKDKLVKKQIQEIQQTINN